MESRRSFLIQSSRCLAAALAAPWISARHAFSTPLGRPVGIQLYTVNGAMQEDPAGTLKKIREIGFGEVETAGFGKLSAKEFRGLLDDAGLACPSAHLQFDMDNLGPTFEAAHALGATYAASGSLPPALVGSKAAPKAAAGSKATAAPLKRSMSLHEAKRTAEVANRIGEAAKRAGLQYVYHNHDFEFAHRRGSDGYDVLLRETDPDLVKFEIDCGWMIFAGRNPIDYFKKYPNRFPMIHVKDFLPAQEHGSAAGKAPMLGAELGHGVVDYKPIFTAAAAAGLKHYFVEQEGPFSRMTPLEAAQVDYDYLHSIG
jgi:sugar phosphate isomerase/epimerase